jgi:hypothetical protein
MKPSLLTLFVVLAGASLAAPPVSAAIDADAQVVKVRAKKSDGSSGCVENGVELNNCFASTGAAATWIMNTRKPTATTPLIVEIGPGNYKGLTLECDATWGGHTTFRGAGMNQTVFDSMSWGTMRFDSCTKLHFSDLTVKNTVYGGISWNGGGESTWTNVQVQGAGQGWYSDYCGQVRGSHYWFSSRITSVALVGFNGRANAYFERCDESWFFGSEITTTVQAGAHPASGGVVNAAGQGIIHVYGSVLRAFIDGPTTGLGVAAARSGELETGGEIHIHGTGIDVTSSIGANIIALYASNGGTIHADASAYNMSTGGTITRIMKDANPATHVHAPYHWQHIPNSPLVSVTGADMTTETIGTDINMLVYNSQCTGGGGPWYNVALRTCR